MVQLENIPFAQRKKTKVQEKHVRLCWLVGQPTKRHEGEEEDLHKNSLEAEARFCSTVGSSFEEHESRLLLL